MVKRFQSLTSDVYNNVMRINSRWMSILLLLMISALFIPQASTSAAAFTLLWQHNRGEWAEHPIIKDGVVYVPWTDGALTAHDLASGELLNSVNNVNDATAPFIVGDKIYSFDVSSMSEIDLETFKITRRIQLPDGIYTENVPYDAATGYFYIREGVVSQYKGRVSAYRLSDGKRMWSYPEQYVGGFDNQQNILVVGDSVFFQSSDSFWRGASKFYRVRKDTGALVWEIPLGTPSRGGYNNPIYDADHDMLYVSESWNSLDAQVYAIRRKDGALAWDKPIPGRAIESTLTYYKGVLYLPLHVFSGHGSYMAISAVDGSTIWHEPGFFNEDGWSATAVDDRYLYRLAHGANFIIIQNKFNGDLVWSLPVDAPATCFNPVMSSGIVILGGESSVYAIKVGTGLAVDSDFHGLNATGSNPKAILWDLLVKTFLPYLMQKK